MCYAFVLLNDLKAHNKLKSNKQPLFIQPVSNTYYCYVYCNYRKEGRRRVDSKAIIPKPVGIQRA